MGNFIALRQSRRLPTDEYEAWLAGLIVTDGHITKPWGYLNIAQKEAALPVFRQLAARFDRNVNVNTQTTNFGGSHTLVRMSFSNLPTCWKTSVPQFQPFSDLERHYWRGVIDGDGCLTFEGRPGGPKRLEVRLAFNPNREAFLGEAYIAFLERLEVPYRVADDQLGDSIRKVRVRRIDHAQQLAEYLYDEAKIALPWKAERAISL